MKKLVLFFVVFLVTFLLLSRVSISPVLADVDGLAVPGTGVAPTPGVWVEDPNVTFVGKVAFRSGSLLDWTLQNHNWMFIPSGGINPLVSFWVTVRNIAYASLAIFILIVAFSIIITRGKNITVMRFIPQFVLVVILITLSFALLQFLYQVIDIIQGFFLKSPSGAGFISQKDLLQINFNYKEFIGYRKYGSAFDESAFMSLLFVKLTAITYYVMIGMLLVRKIILWFFLVISPIFALLFLYSPLKNTAKIWFGEFLRWLLYGPIFSVLLAGVVYVWRAGIPLQFHGFPGSGNEDAIIYPTAVNILLGGPGQAVSLTNSLNTPETFAQYLVALLMLWVVILLPFLLLQILLDYVHVSSLSENTLVKQLINGGSSFFTKPHAPLSSPPIPPSYQPKGAALELPFAKSSFAYPSMVKETKSLFAQNINQKNINQNISQEKSSQASFVRPQMQPYSVSSRQNAASEVLRLTNLSIPTMRDIAKFETSSLSSNSHDHEEVQRIQEALKNIVQPESIIAPAERQRFTSVRTQLLEHEKQGNPMASAVLSAGYSMSQKKSASVAALSTLHALSTKAGSHTAVSAGISSSSVPQSTMMLPVVNRLQSVSLDDYEAVKKLWKESYQKIDVPSNTKELPKDRKTWIKEDIEKIQNTINLLTTHDPQKVEKGMDIVGKILPFLLIGGFSQTEIIAYLKSKIEAAKAVLLELEQKETEEKDEEETTLSRETKTEEKPKTMQAQQALPIVE